MDSFSREIRHNILKISHHSGHGHLPTCFSIVEMLRAVYETMNHNPKQPKDPARDIFILSKGHAALAHYCTLSQHGYFSIKDVYDFGSFNSKFGCHADRNKVPGVEWSTGSLGHGISVAVGFALAMKLKNEARRTYVIIGDGESNEGAVWESLLVAANLKLDNLTIMLDLNNSQLRCLPIVDASLKFASMGAHAVDVDGHNISELKQSLAVRTDGKPLALICHTGKGHGCRTLLENMFAWHRRSPNAEELTMLLKELEEHA